MSSRFAPLSRSFLGFDEVFELADRLLLNGAKAPSFPPYNIYRIVSQDTQTNGFEVEVALAGYKRSDIEVSFDRSKRMLKIAHHVPTTEDEVGNKPENREQLVTGIARRSFELSFKVADDLIVRSASMVDGMLTVRLEKVENPDEQVLRIEVV